MKNNRIVYLTEDVLARMERPTSRLSTAVKGVLECIAEAESGESAETAPESSEDEENTEE